MRFADTFAPVPPTDPLATGSVAGGPAISITIGDVCWIGVRATVLDAFSLNYRIALAEEGCFDRSQASHAINLCDMNAKYADVVKTSEVLDFFDKVPANMFDLPKGAPVEKPNLTQMASTSRCESGRSRAAAKY